MGLLTEKRPYPPMPFGSWKGTPIDQLPRAYLKWLLEGCDIPPKDGWLRDAVKQALAGDKGYTGPDLTSYGHSNGHTTPENDYTGFLTTRMKAGRWFPVFM